MPLMIVRSSYDTRKIDGIFTFTFYTYCVCAMWLSLTDLLTVACSKYKIQKIMLAPSLLLFVCFALSKLKYAVNFGRNTSIYSPTGVRVPYNRHSRLNVWGKKNCENANQPEYKNSIGPKSIFASKCLWKKKKEEKNAAIILPRVINTRIKWTDRLHIVQNVLILLSSRQICNWSKRANVMSDLIVLILVGRWLVECCCCSMPRIECNFACFAILFFSLCEIT